MLSQLDKVKYVGVTVAIRRVIWRFELLIGSPPSVCILGFLCLIWSAFAAVFSLVSLPFKTAFKIKISGVAIEIRFIVRSSLLVTENGCNNLSTLIQGPWQCVYRFGWNMDDYALVIGFHKGGPRAVLGKCGGNIVTLLEMTLSPVDPGTGGDRFMVSQPPGEIRRLCKSVFSI